jgi:uncharacterized protein
VHEPVRLLLIVENKPEKIMEAVHRSSEVTELVANRWIRLVSMSPDGTVRVYRDGVFESLSETVKIPSIPSSVEWYRGKLEHLPIAHVTTTAAHAK